MSLLRYPGLKNNYHGSPHFENKTYTGITSCIFKANNTKHMNIWNKFKTAKVQVRKDLGLAWQTFTNNILIERLEKKYTKPFWNL